MLLIVVIIVTVLMTTKFHKQEVESDDDAEVDVPKPLPRGGEHFSVGEQNRQTWEDRNIRSRINANRAKKGRGPLWSTTDPAIWDVYGDERWSQWPAEWEAVKTKQLAKTRLHPPQQTPSPVDGKILDMWNEGGLDSIIDEAMDEELWDGLGMEKEADAFVCRDHDPLDQSAVLNMGGRGGGKWKNKKMRYLNTHYREGIRTADFPPYTYDSHGNFVNAPKIKSTSGLNKQQKQWYNQPQTNQPTRESLPRHVKDGEMNYREPPDIE